MNKIILDNESIVNLNIKEDSVCNIKNIESLKELKINIENNAKLILNEYSESLERQYIIKITQNSNSLFIYNLNFKTIKSFNLKIEVNLIGNNSSNKINIHGLNDNSKCNIEVNGNIEKNTIDNELYENVKIINLNDAKTTVLPNMYVDTKNVIANHSTSISTINNDYLFYLKSKGIDELDAKQLIIDGFLSNEIDE